MVSTREALRGDVRIVDPNNFRIMKRITAKDKRLSVDQLGQELYEYIEQFIIDPDEHPELMGQIKQDSREFALHCLWNFKQR